MRHRAYFSTSKFALEKDAEDTSLWFYYGKMDKNWTTCAIFLWITQAVEEEQVNVNLVIFGYIYRMRYFALKTNMNSSSMEPLKLCFNYNCTQNGVFKNGGQSLSTNYETSMIVMRDLNRQFCAQWAGE